MLKVICLWCLQKFSVSFCTNFHPVKPERSLDLNNILDFINTSFMNLLSHVGFTCTQQAKENIGSCVSNGCLSSLLRSGWVGEDARWDHAVSHMGLWPYLFMGPLPALFASPHFRMWIESGCLQLQTEAEFIARIEQVVWGKGRNEKRPQSCLVQLPSVVYLL